MKKQIVTLLNCYIAKKPHGLIMIIAALLLITYLLSPISSLAQQGNAITISPSLADLKISDEKIISITLNSASKISAFDLKFATTGPVNITDFRDQPFFDNNFDLFNARQIKREINGANSQLAYIFTAPESALPETVTIYAKIKGGSLGDGKVTLDYNNSQVLDGKGSLLTVGPLSASYNLTSNQSSPDFINPASLPPLKYPDSSAVVDLKLKLYGTDKSPKVNTIKAIAVAVGRIGEGKYETAPRQFDLTPNSDGTYSGKVAFPNFKDGNKFSLMIKVDKYLLRRICNPDAAEAKIGAYVCQEPGLTIRKGQDNTFDFSKVALLPGDLGLTDGVLNGYDLSLVRNNLNKNTPEAVGLADLNLDATVDKKDFEIIGFVAANTNRAADQ